MDFSSSQFSTEWLRRADTVARAVHLWVRRQALVRLCAGKEISAESQRGYIGGLIEGLSDSMGLTEQEHQMVAYAYCLLSGADKDTLLATRELLDVRIDPSVSSSYLEGLSAAQSLYAGVCLTMTNDSIAAGRQSTRAI
jgi:hypothetical protein